MAVGIALCLAAGRDLNAQNRTDDYYLGIARGLELFGEVFREILEHYAGSVEPFALAEAGVNGVLYRLDPYSSYVSEEEIVRNMSRRNLRVGIGVDLEIADGFPTISNVVPGHSAEETGVRIGDRVIAIDGNDVSNASLDSVHVLLRGEIGSGLSMTVRRPGRSDTLMLMLKRERVRIPSLGVSERLPDGTIYVQLKRFGENSANELRAELLRMLRFSEQSGNGARVILDLRGNSGGVLEEAVSIAENFVPKGELIVATDGRDSVERMSWYSERDPVAAGVPLVVLVDRGTASASELLAAAVQDHDLGVIVGEPTVGKGLVQSVNTLPFGASIRLTTAWYITPSGRSIQRLDRLNGTSDLRIVPDSLLVDRLSDRGRPLPAGVGVIPDSLVPGPSLRSIIGRLEDAGAFFSFASEFAGPIDSLPNNFTVSDRTLTLFEEQGLGTLLAAEQQYGRLASLDSLQEGYAESGSSPNVLNLFDELTRAIIRDDERLFAARKEAIRARLEREIRERFPMSDTDHVELLLNDPQVTAAIGLLKNRSRYRSLLGE